MANKVVFNSLDSIKYARREAFNSLRSNLKFCGADIKTILFTSCQPDEGKSVVSFELARSIAENGKNVLLIDADLRKSVLFNRYNLKLADRQQKGLTHYLSGQGAIEEVIVETNIDGMDMILTGPLSPNPTELLSGHKMDELLASVREKYDTVIIDSPPIGAVIDAAVVAPKCDGVVLVIESESVSKRLAVMVKQQLEKTGCKIIGTVLNKVQPEKGGYYGKYGKYKHYGQYKPYGEYK